MEECIFLSREPKCEDVYKARKMRYVCRNINRLQNDRKFSDRLIGKDTCENCPYKFTQSQVDAL